jgi:hypothetical protein
VCSLLAFKLTYCVCVAGTPHSMFQILCGGENVYCSEVEAVLAAHPAVALAAVFGVPSALLGEMVAAAVVLRQEAVGAPAAPTAASLISWCQERLAHYKVPAQVRGSDSVCAALLHPHPAAVHPCDKESACLSDLSMCTASHWRTLRAPSTDVVAFVTSSNCHVVYSQHEADMHVRLALAAPLSGTHTLTQGGLLSLGAYAGCTAHHGLWQGAQNGAAAALCCTSCCCPISSQHRCNGPVTPTHS